MQLAREAIFSRSQPLLWDPDTLEPDLNLSIPRGAFSAGPCYRQWCWNLSSRYKVHICSARPNFLLSGLSADRSRPQDHHRCRTEFETSRLRVLDHQSISRIILSFSRCLFHLSWISKIGSYSCDWICFCLRILSGNSTRTISKIVAWNFEIPLGGLASQ